MKLYITDKGDPSVGIFDETWTVEAPFNEDDVDALDLNEFKNMIIDVYKEFSFGKIIGQYENELK